MTGVGWLVIVILFGWFIFVKAVLKSLADYHLFLAAALSVVFLAIQIGSIQDNAYFLWSERTADDWQHLPHNSRQLDSSSENTNAMFDAINKIPIFADSIATLATTIAKAGVTFFCTNSVITLITRGDTEKLETLQAHTKMFSYAGK